MAELLGATAASLQIAELFAKAAIRGFRLAQQLKDAPDELLRNSQSLEDFRCLCESYQETLTANAAQINAAIRPQDVSRIQDFISRAEATLGSLEAILLHLRAQSSTTWMESKVKAVKTIRKHGDIMIHLHNLDKLKQQIQSYFVHHIWVLSMDQCGKTQTGFTALANSQQQMKEQLTSQASSIGSSLQAINLGNSSIETKLTDGIISLQSAAEAVKDSVRDSHDDMVTRLRGNELTLSDDSTRHLAAQLVTLTSTAEQQQVVSRVSSTTLPSELCPCQRIPISQLFGTIGPFVVLQRTLGAHQIGCKYHSGGERVTTKKWFALGLRSTYGHTWMAALARLFVSIASSFFRYTTCARVFGDDEKYIPGFRRISEAMSVICQIQCIGAHGRRDLDSWYYPSIPSTSSHIQQYRKVLLKLHDALRDDFNASRDWEGVQTQHGKTPLHFTDRRQVAGLLVIMRSKTSILARYNTPLLWTKVPKSPQEQPEYPAIRKPVAIGIFRDIPDFAIEYGSSRVCVATVTKDKHQLKQLIQWGVQIDSPTDLVSPLALALDWEEGFNILLGAGADTAQATEYAIRHGDVRLIKLLLATDQFYFKPNALAFTNDKREYQEIWPNDAWFWSDSILGGLLGDNANEKDKRFIPMVCKAYMTARRKLMEEAKRHFSTSQLEDLGWNENHFKGQLIDLAALRTYSRLRESGVTLEMRLWPGTSTTVYHIRYMTAEVAEVLWGYGFRELDEVDDKAMTPLFIVTTRCMSSHLQYLETILWLLNHGAQNMFFGDLIKSTFVHALASEIENSFSHQLYAEYTHEVLERQLAMILRKAGSVLGFRPRDSCQCFCSRNGCSPIQSLMRPQIVIWGKKVMDYFVPEVLDPRAERTGPIFSDGLEECLQQIRRHTVRSMEIAARVEDAALSWLIERVELGLEF
ncbi:hypothetical protein PG984_000108 [Apiospora sp. TS-2023a]